MFTFGPLSVAQLAGVKQSVYLSGSGIKKNEGGINN